MPARRPARPRAARLGRLAVALGFLVIVVVLLLWLAGAFGRKIRPDTAVPVPTAAAIRATATVRLERLPVYETAVGTIEPVLRSHVASRILSRVVAIEADAGRRVEAGTVLVRLDDTDLRERLAGAEAALDAERSTLEQVREEFARIERSHERQAASELELIRARSAVRTAEARVTGAERTVAEAAIILDYTIVTAPFTGLVVEKSVEVGDTVLPGDALLEMYDPTRMQLVADVPESLSPQLAVGDEVLGRIDALDLDCIATVAEIVPQSAADSRSFRVKVTGPCPPGVHPGMFGRIRIPLGEREVVLVPGEAVRRVGQLDLVDVVETDGDVATTITRTVRLGRPNGDDVEVLAGLRPGEVVALRAGTAERRP